MGIVCLCKYNDPKLYIGDFAIVTIYSVQWHQTLDGEIADNTLNSTNAVLYKHEGCHC